MNNKQDVEEKIRILRIQIDNWYNQKYSNKDYPLIEKKITKKDYKFSKLMISIMSLIKNKTRHSFHNGRKLKDKESKEYLTIEWNNDKYVYTIENKEPYKVEYKEYWNIIYDCNIMHAK